MEKLPPEVRLPIYKRLDLDSVLKMRTLNSKFKEEVSELMTFNVIMKKSPLQLPLPLLHGVFKMKVGSFKLKDENPSIEFMRFMLFMMVRGHRIMQFPTRTPLLRYPEFLKTIDICCNWIEKRFFLQLLRESTKLENFTLEVKQGFNRTSREAAHSMYLQSILDRMTYLQSLNLKSQHDINDSVNQVYFQILNSFFPALSSFSLDIPTNCGRKDKVRLVPLFFNFVSKHWMNLRELMLNFTFLPNENCLIRFRNSVEVGMEEVKKVDHLTKLTINEFVDLNIESKFKKFIILLIKAQTYLEHFTYSSEIINMELLKYVIRTNSESLRTFEATGTGLSVRREGENHQIMDLSILGTCTKLNTWCMSIMFSLPCSYIRLVNLHRIPPTVQDIKIILSKLTEGNELRQFSEMDRPKLMNLTLADPYPAPIPDLCQILGNLIHNHRNIPTFRLEIERGFRMDGSGWEWNDPGWRTEFLRMEEFFQRFSDCRIKHYYVSKSRQPDLDYNEVQEGRIDGFKADQVSSEVLKIGLCNLTPDDREVAFQVWANPFQPGLPIELSSLKIRGCQTDEDWDQNKW